ncbi:MAG TPA: MFS transporter [Actinophytocola sp.]|jgi:OPA family glycerol-3-phosphate transporter-like MFS transporter|uniref:MFS transporter n=1 Tax=Actinophytocola sp. TaxID=1872138 RepID=UPI002E084A96|nr:MFS transporter [Actinophytocola sp.]
MRASWSYVRDLDEYPEGLRRMWILAMAVLAVLVGSYEAQIAPVVPLLLADLDIDLTTYGSVSAVAAVSGAIAAAIGGRLTDHLGRVRLLVPLMLLTALCCLAMTLVHSARDLLIVRVVLAFVDGMALASTAPLVRDFSPRLGRAQAFGFWTWGPVGASLLAAGLAAATLPAFHDSWRSQFVIMAVVSLVLSVVIATNIADLSPQLRARIRQTERTVVGTVDATRRARGRDLLSQPRLWAHAVGISLWLVLYLTLAMYGPAMLVDSFGVSTAKASAIMSAFWVFDLVVLIAAGRVSDRLQLRKPFALGGTLAAGLVAGYLAVLMGRSSVSAGLLMLTGALLGAALAVAFGPWMANYSEDAEDVDPRLQGTAWGIFGFASRAMAVLVLLVVPPAVAATSWQTWLLISLVCLLLFVPAVFLFGGRWRRGPG